MADAFDAFFGVGSGLGEDSQPMIDALRGQKRDGDFLGMSTIQNVAQAGQKQSDQALAAGKHAGGLKMAREAEQRRKEEEQFIHERNAGLAKTVAATQRGNAVEDRDLSRGNAVEDRDLSRGNAVEDRDLSRVNTVADRVEDRVNAVEDRDVGRGYAMDDAATLRAQQVADDAEAARIAKMERDFAEGKTTAATFHHPTKPDAVLNYSLDSQGQYYDENHEPVSAEGLTPYRTGSEKNAQKLASVPQQKYNKEIDDQIVTDEIMNGLVNRVIGGPLDKITGRWNPDRYIAEYTNRDPETQSLQRQSKRIVLEAVAPILDTLGVNPTDADLKEAFKTQPSLVNEPVAWIDWYEHEYMTTVLSKVRKGKRPESYDAAKKAMQQVADNARLKDKKSRGIATVEAPSKLSEQDAKTWAGLNDVQRQAAIDGGVFK